MEYDNSAAPPQSPYGYTIKDSLIETKFVESRYRWVVVALMCVQLLLNGFINNSIIPIQSKLAIMYDISETLVNLPIILSFLVFSIVNFPANVFIDWKGLRWSFIIGSILYATGVGFYCFINYSYGMMIIGTIIFSLGQPFIINCPAKIAAFWFFPQNRALATAIMVGVNIVGVGIGFLLPTLVVYDDLPVDESQTIIVRLYIGYFILAAIQVVLGLVFMRPKPAIAPSISAEKYKLSFKQSVLLIRQDLNLLHFFFAYTVLYGSFVIFASEISLIMKPYNFTDVEIAVSAILLIFSGVIGSIIFSLLLKKTSNYRMVLSCLLGGTICAITCFPINILFGNWKIVTIIAFTVLGFFMTPIIPVSYDLGCELAFPMGEAQVTGFLNGAALLWAFLIGLIMSLIIGYGDSHKSLFWILGLFVLIMSGALLLKTVKLNLKRKDFETNKLETTMTPVEVEMTAQQDKAEENQSKIVDFVEVDYKYGQYANLVEYKLV